MTIIPNAECMASSAPNPYGQPPPGSTDKIYFSEHNQSPSHQQTKQTANKTSTTPIPGGQQLHQQQQHHQYQHPQQHQQQTPQHHQRHMPHDGGEKPLVQSSSLLANYDGYIGGMSSDSELTAAGTTSRHHHFHHHRPYSSQSRVYHAHPVPRNLPASSRLSHYSDSAAASVQSSAIPNSFLQQQQPHLQHHQHQQQQRQQQQHQIGTSPLGSMTSPANPISLSHQGSVSSSGSASSSYLGGVIASESPMSPVMAQHQQQQQLHQQYPTMRSQSGRQLPQRPFKQSMSIDHHSLSTQYRQPLGQLSSPVQHSSLSSARNLTDQPLTDPIQIVNYPQQQQHQPPAPTHQPAQPQHSSYAVSQQLFDHYGGSSRNMRLEMEMMEKQAANLSLYDANTAPGDNPAARLPPSGSSRPLTSHSSSPRHLPSVGGPASGHAQGLIGSMSLDQHHVDPFQHHLASQHLQQDPFAPHPHLLPQQQSQPAHRLGSSSSEWNSPIGMSSQQQQQHHHPPRTSGHIKQTMSIDQYPTSSTMHPQHYSTSRATQFANDQHYNSAPAESYSGLSQSMYGGAYNSAPPNQAYYQANQESPELQHHQQLQQQKNYYHQTHQQQPIIESSKQPLQQLQQQMPADYPNVGNINPNIQQQQQQQHHHQHISAKPTLHHQVSSSSSNSNQSGSLKSSNTDNTADKQPNTNEHHKSSLTNPIASGSSSSQPHGSRPHTSAGQQHRQDMLRRGYTSATMTYGAGGGGASGAATGELGGSQTTLSESGDSSMTHTNAATHGSGQFGLRAASPSMTLEASSSGSAHRDHHHHQHHTPGHGSGRDTGTGIRSESSTGLPNGSSSNSTLTKKSNSATQLSMTGTKKRLGFRKKQVTSFSVHRSEEVAPLEARHLVKQGSSVSEGDSSISGDSSSRSWSNSNFKQQTSEELASMSFIDGLGKGQMISRQGLASPYLGDIQLSLCDKRGNLEVEVIRARNLQAKTNKVLPLTYVKLYLVKNRKCLAKAKTPLSNKRTLNPLFQQQLTFHEDYRGCILQSIVWGNFGKMDKKNFMGIAQISIDDLELSNTVISWYKLFLPSSLQTLPSKSLRHTLLSNSTESFTNTNNS